MTERDFNVGVDCVEIDEVKKIVKRERLLKKIFTPREIKHCLSRKNSAQCLAARFAGKEAIQKAVSTEIPLNQIEILNEKNGRPKVKIMKRNRKSWTLKISLSHTSRTAFAVVLATEKR